MTISAESIVKAVAALTGSLEATDGVVLKDDDLLDLKAHVQQLVTHKRSLQASNEDETPSSDYLQDLEGLPNEIKAVLARFDQSESYPELDEMIAELEAVGWTADYDLGGTVFDLRPMTEEEKAIINKAAATPIVAASMIFEKAQSAVNDMGDIFFEPQADCGEYSLPANIATNACSAAIESALRQAGVIIEGSVPKLDESCDPEAGEAK